MRPESSPALPATCPVDHGTVAPARWEEPAHKLSKLPGSDRLAWLLSYGLSTGIIGYGARRGDLIARLQMDPELRREPFAAYDEVRAIGPVMHGRGISATADHAAATQILRSHEFGVGGGSGQFPEPLRRLLDKVIDPLARGPVDAPSLLALDPPLHTRYRRLVTRAFTAREVTGREELVQATADRLLDRIVASGRKNFDLVDSYTALLPVAVISDILGVPEPMQQQILEWGNAAAFTLDPTLSWRQYRQSTRALRGLAGWFDEHIDGLRRNPGDDLLSQLAALEGADRLSSLELRATGLLVLGAGFETTVNLMSNGVQLFSEHPEQLEVLRDDPSHWDNAVEEVLRFESPIQVTLRQAYADVEVNGVRVPAGRPVVVMLGGTNRDPAVFGDPHTFDVLRSNASDNLAFSSGVHFCLGASLAKLEATVGLRALYDRFPDLTVSGEPTRRATRVLRGWEHLPVAV